MGAAFIDELAGAVMQVLLFSVIPFVWWLIGARKKEAFPRWLGFRKIEHRGSAIATVLLSAAVFLLYGSAISLFAKYAPGEISLAGSRWAGKGISYLPAALAYGFIRTGLSEEILFRGFLLKRIAERYGFASGNIIQAVLFGLLHGVPFGIASGSGLIAVVFTLLPAGIGYYMGWVNEKMCGGSIIPSWLMHGITNAAVACMSL